MKQKSTTKQCKYCKTDIPADAKFCPNCKKKQKGKGWLIAIIAIVVIIGIIGSTGDTEDTTTDIANKGTETASNTNKKEKATEKTAKKTTEKSKEEVMKIDPETLITDYEANEVKGDEIYEGKTMELTGIVGDIGKDILEDVYITFEREEEFAFTAVQCYFKDEAQIKKVMELSKGDKITLQGKCDGKFGNVLIKNCVIK